MEPSESTTIGIDLIKQLLTLATSIVTFSAVFGKDLLSVIHQAQSLRVALFVCWTLYLLSAIFGVLALMAIVGWTADTTGRSAGSILVKPNVRLFAGLQIAFLAFSLCSTLVLGYLLSFSITVGIAGH
jgi:hypothetical protein